MLYYSASGDFSDFAKINPVAGNFEPWGLAYGNGEWIVKLADTSSGNLTNGDPVDIYFITSSDGITWSSPVVTHLTAYYDYSIAFCGGIEVIFSSTISCLLSTSMTKLLTGICLAMDCWIL